MYHPTCTLDWEISLSSDWIFLTERWNLYGRISFLVKWIPCGISSWGKGIPYGISSWGKGIPYGISSWGKGIPCGTSSLANESRHEIFSVEIRILCEIYCEEMLSLFFGENGIPFGISYEVTGNPCGISYEGKGNPSGISCEGKGIPPGISSLEKGSPCVISASGIEISGVVHLPHGPSWSSWMICVLATVTSF